MRIENPEKFGFSPQRLQRISPIMQRYIDDGKIAGFALLAARRGNIVFCDTLGYQDIESQTPMAIDTIFRIYSMTKPITGVALMTLFEQGLIHLEDPVSKFVPEFSKVRVIGKDEKFENLKTDITVHHLLTHTAGISYAELEEPSLAKFVSEIDIWNPKITLKEMVGQIAKLPLLYQPGEKWHYSLATDVLGHIIEIISEKSVADYFDEIIFQPLGMKDTSFSVPEDKKSRFATLYGQTKKNPNPLGLIDEETGGVYDNPTLHCPGHGLVSTIDDYFKFAQLILNKGELNGLRLLSPKTVEFMTTNHLPSKLVPIEMEGKYWQGMGIGFGLCFSVLMDNALNGTMISNGSHGWGGWASTKFWVDPVEKIIGIMMLQSIPSYTYPIVNDFRTAVYQALIE